MAVQQLWAKRDLAGLPAFAMRDADDRALRVDVLGAELAQFGAAHSRGVEGHEDGA